MNAPSDRLLSNARGEYVHPRQPTSWIIKERATGRVVREIFDARAIGFLRTEKYVAVPILEHLQSLNK